MRPRVIADSFSLWLKLGLKAPAVLVFVACALLVIAIAGLLSAPSSAGNMDSLLVAAVVSMAVLPFFLALVLKPGDPFVHLLPIGRGERQVATAALLQAVPLALGAVLCLLVRAEERALVTAAVLAAAGTGAFAVRLGLAALPSVALGFFVAPVLVGLAVNRLSAPALLAMGVATTIGNLVLPERLQQPAAVHPRRLVDRPRPRRRSSLLRLFLRADGSAWAPAGALVVFPLFFVWDPGTRSAFPVLWVAGLAGLAVARFTFGGAGQMLFVLPVRRIRLVLPLASYLLVSVTLMPLAIVATAHAAGDRLAPRIASCTSTNGNRYCEATVERRMAVVLQKYFGPLPQPATVRLVDGRGRVEIVPSSVSMAAWRAKVLRGALWNILFGMMVAGATILIYPLVAQRRRVAVP